MKKLLFIAFFIVGLSLLFPKTIFSDIKYNYIVVNKLADGDLTSCDLPSPNCSLNAALKVAEESDLDTVLLVKVPYFDAGTNSHNLMPFYAIKEKTDNTIQWKVVPAPLIASTDLTNLKETITDYFLTLNTGILQSNGQSNFFSSLFFGQFWKYYPEQNKNDYDYRSPTFRIIQIPTGGVVFNTSVELKNYIQNNLQYQKIFLQGVYLRVYEDSLSRAVFIGVFILTLLLGLLNLLVFPNLILYFIVLLRNVEKTKVIGVLYDDVSGAPVSFAILRVYSMQNGQRTFLKQTISDLDGKYYGFTLPKGKYLFEVKSDKYKTNEQESEIFEKEGILAFDIGLSKVDESFNRALLKRLKDFVLNNIKQANAFLVYLCLFIAALNIIISQSGFNIFILFFASAEFILYEYTKRRRNLGIVTDAATSLPLKRVFVKVFDPENYNQLDVRLSDEDGRFGFILRKPEYLLSVKSIGYKYSPKDKNPKVTSNSGEQFIKLTVPKNKNIDLKILLEKEV